MHDMNIDDYEITQDSYFEMVEEIDISLVQCPCCEHTGVFENTEMTYVHSVINTVEELSDPLNIELSVVYCQNRKTYHAIIPWALFLLRPLLTVSFLKPFTATISKMMKTRKEQLKRWAFPDRLFIAFNSPIQINFMMIIAFMLRLSRVYNFI